MTVVNGKPQTSKYEAFKLFLHRTKSSARILGRVQMNGFGRGYNRIAENSYYSTLSLQPAAIAEEDSQIEQDLGGNVTRWPEDDNGE